MHHCERQAGLNSQTSLKPVVEFGCAATDLLASLRRKDLVDEGKVFFNKDCRICAVNVVEYLQSKITIGSTFVISMSCLNLHSLVKLGVSIVVEPFANILQSLTRQNIGSNSKGDASIG